MARSQPYPAPPIVDAVIELRLQKPLIEAEILRLVKSFQGSYDQHEASGEVDVQIRLDAGKLRPVLSVPRPIHRFSSNDQTDFFRIETTKFHWSRLPPYQGWESFEARVLRDVKRLPKRFGFPALERIGVRFQNRIDVPAGADGVHRYEDFLSVNIGLPPLLEPQNAYLWKVDKLFAEMNLRAVVTSTIVPPELPGTIAILLDCDVSGLTDLPRSINDLSAKLAQMRVLKNEIFEACITDKARQSFR